MALLVVEVLAQLVATTLIILAETEGQAEVPAFLERPPSMLVAVALRLAHLALRALVVLAAVEMATPAVLADQVRPTVVVVLVVVVVVVVLAVLEL
jgi:hypothetical protein